MRVEVCDACMSQGHTTMAYRDNVDVRVGKADVRVIVSSDTSWRGFAGDVPRASLCLEHLIEALERGLKALKKKRGSS